MYRRLSFCITLTCVSLSIVAQDTIQQITPGRVNTKQSESKPYLILISADGFRYDYADKYDAVNLKQLRASGVQAVSMKPSYPSVTFPNHYTVATGLYPSHHGLVYNQFYDRNRKQSYNMADRKAVEDGTWYGGVPLWVLAEEQGMITASYHFVGTEAPIKNTLPTYWYRFSNNTGIDFRIRKLVEWLELPADKRPHLITFYFSEVDHAGHIYGPEAKETRDAVLYVDSAIGKMVQRVKETGLPVNFIFLADHGMAPVDTTSRINIGTMIDTSRFYMRGGGTSLHLYAKNKKDIMPTYLALKKQAKDFRVFLRGQTPAHWHYSIKDDYFNRIGDIFIVPVYPKILTSWTGMISPGAHGFDPEMKKMHATFYAWGPNFKKGLTINTFENINVYPMVCKLLGLTYTHKIDGKLEVLKGILK